MTIYKQCEKVCALEAPLAFFYLLVSIDLCSCSLIAVEI